MPESSIDINKFLELNEFSNSKFLIFGEEPSLVVKVKNHALAKEDLRMIEKVYLNMEQEDLSKTFIKQCYVLFNEKSCIYKPR